MLKSFVFPFLFAIVSIWPGSASATSYSGTRTYFTQIHFSKIAFDKEVAGVYAHVGLLTSNPFGDVGSYFWSAVQHTRMEEEDGKFTAKVVLSGPVNSHGNSVLNAVIQYWIYFSDGTSMISNESKIEEKSWSIFQSGDPDYLRTYKEKKQELEDEDNIEATKAVVIEHGHVS